MPIIGCEQSVCFVALAWHAELLAAFLAWWMPVNLITYLVLTALVAMKWGIKPEATELKRLLLVMFVTLPFVAFLFVLWVAEELFLKPRRRAQQREIDARNQAAYSKICNSRY